MSDPTENDYAAALNVMNYLGCEPSQADHEIIAEMFQQYAANARRQALRDAAAAVWEVHKTTDDLTKVAAYINEMLDEES